VTALGAPTPTASRTHDPLSPIETELCAVERTDQISADPLLCGVLFNRTPSRIEVELTFATVDGPTFILDRCQ